MLSLIVAVAANGVIGRDNQLPWHLPEDLRHFKQMTLGKAMVMGRKTYQSIGRPLPGRRSIVVSRNPGWQAVGVETAGSLTAALALAAPDEVMVIGGASLFAEALPLADRLFLTDLHRAYDGDVSFPAWDRDAWREVWRRDSDGDPPVSYRLLQRR